MVDVCGPHHTNEPNAGCIGSTRKVEPSEELIDKTRLFTDVIFTVLRVLQGNRLRILRIIILSLLMNRTRKSILVSFISISTIHLSLSIALPWSSVTHTFIAQKSGMPNPQYANFPDLSKNENHFLLGPHHLLILSIESVDDLKSEIAKVANHSISLANRCFSERSIIKREEALKQIAMSVSLLKAIIASTKADSEGRKK